MSAVLTILQKVVVNHFYRVNAGFFLFVFFLLFGVPVNLVQFHLAIIQLITQNASGLAAAAVLWLLYNLKCMDYVLKHLRGPRQQFLFCINNLPARSCFGYMLFVQTAVYLPLLVYSIVAAIVAFNQRHYQGMAAILLLTAAMLLFAAAVYTRALQRRPLFNGVALPTIGIRFGKPLFSIPLYWLLHKRRQMLLVTKFFSLLVLYVFMHLYQPDGYDIRPLLLCFMLATAANTSIVYQLKTFEDSHLAFVKNFPLALAKRFAFMLGMYTVLMLPELGFVCKGWPLFFHAADFLQLLLLSTGLLALFHGSLLTDDMDTEAFYKIVFAVLAVLFFVMLYNPGILLECLIVAVAFGLYASYYNDFEKKYN